MVVPMVDLTADWALQLYMPHNNMLWLWLRMGVVGFMAFWVMMGAAIVLVGACVRLGVARLRVIAEQERTELERRAGMLDAGPAATSVPFLSPVGLYRVRLERPDHVEAQRVARQGTGSVHMIEGRLSKEGQECAEFLVLALMAMATIVSLVAMGVVDQGLMSFRLTAYAGIVLGSLAAGWNRYSIEYRQVPGLIDVEPLPKEEETVVLHVAACETLPALEALRADMDDLLGRSDNASIFSTWGWVDACWRFPAPGRTPLVLTVRNDADRLVGVLPLAMTTRLRVLRTYEVLGCTQMGYPMGDYGGLVTERGAESAAWYAILKQMKSQRWGVIDMRNCMVGAPEREAQRL